MATLSTLTHDLANIFTIDTALYILAIIIGYGVAATYWAHLVRVHQVNVARSRGGNFAVTKENCDDSSSSYLWHEFICIYSRHQTSEKDQECDKRRRSHFAKKIK